MTFPNVLVIKLIGNVPEVTRKAAIEFVGMLMPSSEIIMILCIINEFLALMRSLWKELLEFVETCRECFSSDIGCIVCMPSP